MTPASTSVPSVKKAILSQHALWENLLGIASTHFNDQLVSLTQRLVGALLDVDDLSDARRVYVRIKSGNLLRENSYAFVHLATTGLELALRRETELLVPSMKKASAAVSELALVPLEEMDNQVAFDGFARPFEFKYAAPIATLNVRLGVLLGRDILRTSQSPFRPDVLLKVLDRAWREFDPDEQSHDMFAPLLRPEVLFDLAPLYEALSDALVHKGAQAQSVEALNIKKTQHAAAARQARAKQKADLARQLRQFLDEDTDGAAPAGASDIPLIPELPPMSGAGGWRPSGAAGFHVPGVGAAPAAGQGVAAPSRTRPAPGWADAQPRQAPGQFASGGAGFVPAEGYVPAAGNPLHDLLRHLQASLPAQLNSHAGAAAPQGAGMSGEPGMPGAHGASVFYLPKLKESMKGSLSRRDEGTIDLLSKIFDTVFIDPNIPAEIRELIGLLQIPVLRAALADKNFFFEDGHPARRLIDLISRIGMEQRRADDPLYQAMRRSVDQVGSDIDGQQSTFSQALAELEQSVKKDEEAAQSAIAAPIAAALRQEKATAAARSARTAVAARIGSGQVVAMLETFLESKWTSVLTLAYSVEEDKPGAVKNATRTMDDLIWSVKPKITKEERRSLISRLPGLLAALNRWLDVIKWEDAARLQFFAELAECHASIVRAPLDITPERQLEIAVEVAQQDALRRLEKEREAERLAEQKAGQASAPAAEVDEVALAIEALERGQWLEFLQSDGSARKVKLAWVSPLRTLFIFSTGARQEAFSLPVEKLQAAFRDKKVAVLRMDGVVGRVLQDAMQGAGNDPSVQGAAAA